MRTGRAWWGAGVAMNQGKEGRTARSSRSAEAGQDEARARSLEEADVEPWGSGRAGEPAGPRERPRSGPARELVPGPRAIDGRKSGVPHGIQSNIATAAKAADAGSAPGATLRPDVADLMHSS